MDIMQRLQSLEKFGIKPGLGRITAMLGFLHHPETSYKTIIVGGTNGKGSTCAMVDSILRAAGYRTGFYSSPHLVSLNERIRVNGTMIEDAAFEAIAEHLFGIIDEHTEAAELTYFEFMTAAALLHFKNEKIDCAVLEVGMGGRFDAVNAVQPEVSIITNIALDHQHYLGTTVEQIAREKAGIIRKGRPFVTTDTAPASRRILEEECSRQGGVLYALNRDFSISGTTGNFDFNGKQQILQGLQISLNGRHQLDNAAAAIQAVLLLGLRGTRVTGTAIKNGLALTSWPGRFELVHKKPDVILDSAHNPAGVHSLVQAFKDTYCGREPAGPHTAALPEKLSPSLDPPVPLPDNSHGPSHNNRASVTIVFAVSKDKDWRAMLTLLASIAQRFVVTSYTGERSADPGELADFIRSNNLAALQPDDIADRPERALTRALAITPDTGVILVTGSIFFIGEIKKETVL